MRKAMTSAALACVLGGWSLAAQAGHFVRSTSAESTVTANPDGTFNYQVFVQGDEFNGVTDNRGLLEFDIPYFADMDVTNVQVSGDWNWSIEATNDVFGIGGGVLRFTEPDDDYDGVFSFDAGFAGTKGPFYALLLDQQTDTTVQFWGDPLIPASPDTLRALAAVPEPTSLATVFAGLALLGGAALRRRGVR